MAITNDLPSVFCWVSQMASSHTSSSISLSKAVKAVHGDVTALLNAEILSKTDDGMIVFPYDAIHVDFMLKAA